MRERCLSVLGDSYVCPADVERSTYLAGSVCDRLNENRFKLKNWEVFSIDFF